MKIDRIGLECVENKFLKLPNIQKYEVIHRTEGGFIASVEMDIFLNSFQMEHRQKSVL